MTFVRYIIITRWFELYDEGVVMKKYTVYLLIFMTWCAPVFAEQKNLLDTFAEHLKTFFTNYDKIKDVAEDSRLQERVSDDLKWLSSTARFLQSEVVRKRFKGIDLPHDVGTIVTHYEYMIRQKKRHRRVNAVGTTRGRWLAYASLTRQIKFLRKQGFFVADPDVKTAYKSSKNGEFDAILRRIEKRLSIYSRRLKNLSKFSRNELWVHQFETNLVRLNDDIREVQAKLVKEKIKLNLVKDFHPLMECYEDIKGILATRNRIARKDNIKIKGLKNNRRKNISKKQARADKRRLEKAKKRLEDTLDAAAAANEQVRKDLVYLKDMGFSLSPTWHPIKEREGKVSHKKRDNEDEGEKSNEEKSLKTLARMIRKIRNKIIKEDDSMTGLSSTTIKKYLKTLSKSQKQRYKQILSRYRKRGYDTEQAASNAVLEIHGDLTNNLKQGLTKKEALAILRAVERNRE